MELKHGMTLTIEPMINAGKFNVKMLNDGWTAVTKDKSLSAQFEHTVGITENGYEIFTESAKGYSKPPYSYASLSCASPLTLLCITSNVFTGIPQTA